MPGFFTRKAAKDKSTEQTRGCAQKSARQPTEHGSEADIMFLQHTAGNRAVQRFLNEAVIQRKCACGGTCAHCQSEKAQREQDMVQHILQRKGSGQPLEPGMRASMEAQFGEKFSGVRVHTDTHASQTAQHLNAAAYTVGQDIFFGNGLYRPQTHKGRRLLAHELTHVVQQAGAPTSVALGQTFRLSEPSDRFEQTAEQVANRVLKGHAAGPIAAAPALAQRTIFRAVHPANANFIDPNECWFTPGNTPDPSFNVAVIRARLETPDTCTGSINTKTTVTTSGASRRPGGGPPGGATAGFFNVIRFGVSDGRDTGGLRMPTATSGTDIDYALGFPVGPNCTQVDDNVFVYVKLEIPQGSGPASGEHTFVEVKYSPRISRGRGGRVLDTSPNPTIRVEPCDRLRPSGAITPSPTPSRSPTTPSRGPSRRSPRGGGTPETR